MTNPQIRVAPAPAPAKIITGGMTVEITIGEVKITITGPVAKVIAVLNLLFPSKEPSAVIASMQLVFGPETVSMRQK